MRGLRFWGLDVANTTYTSPTINTPAKRERAYTDLAVLAQHCAAGTGDYDGINIVSVSIDLITTRIITIIVTNPLPARQLARFALT